MAIHSRAEEINMMCQPDKWPLSFFLPLVHRDKNGKKDDFGFLVQTSMQIPCPAPDPIVHIGLLASVSKERPIESFNKIQYSSISAIVDNGWEVD